MKKIIFIVFIIGLNCAFASDVVDNNKTDEPVVAINQVLITEARLKRQVDALMPRTFYHATITDEKLAKVKQEAIDDLIERESLVLYAINRGYKPDDKIIKERVAEVKKRFGTDDRMREALKQRLYTYDSFVAELKKDSILEGLYKKEIETEVSEKELEEYYNKNKFKFMMPEKLKVRIIYTKNNPTDPKGKSKAMKRAKEALSEIAKRQALVDEGNITVDTNATINIFADVAAEYSEAMSRINGGDMGFVHRGMLEADVEDTASKLNIGEISGIIELDKGCYIVKLEGKSPPEQLSFDIVKTNLAKDLKKKYEKQKLEDITSEAKKEVKIEYFGSYKNLK